jgi:hypothetical protein
VVVIEAGSVGRWRDRAWSGYLGGRTGWMFAFFFGGAKGVGYIVDL